MKAYMSTEYSETRHMIGETERRAGQAFREACAILAETEPAGLAVYETRIFGKLNGGRFGSALAEALAAFVAGERS